MEEVAIFKLLGLTGVQAKVYITLAKSTTLTVSSISKHSKIQRTDLYEVLKTLEKKGLVEREITQPVTYRAIPVIEAVDLLLQNKNDEHLLRQKKATELKEAFANVGKNLAADKQNGFKMLPKQRVSINVGRAIDAAQKSICFIASKSQLIIRLAVFSNEIESAFSRGVKCRIITEKTSDNLSFLSQISHLNARRNCEIRILSEIPQVVTGIFDQKEFIVFEKPTDSISGSAALWSSNESLAFVMTDYFERLWLLAEKLNQRKTKRDFAG